MDAPTQEQEKINQEPIPSAIPPRKAFPNQSIAIIIGLIMVIVAASYVSLLYLPKNILQNLKPTSNATIRSQGDGVPKTIPQNSTLTSIPTPIPNTAVQWRGYGIPIADLKLIINYKDDYYPSVTSSTDETISAKYYDMGLNGNNKIILAISPSIDLSGPRLFFFEQTSEGYRSMTDMFTSNIYTPAAKQGYVLSPKLLPADTTTFYEGIIAPTNITYRDIKLQKIADFVGPAEGSIDKQKTEAEINIDKVDTIPAGDIHLGQVAYSSTGGTSTQFYIKSYRLKLPSGFYASYDIKYDFLSDNSVPNITWNDGAKNQDAYYKNAHLTGCGYPGGYVTSTRDVSNDIQQTGTTNTGQAIYELKNINDPIIEFFYDQGTGKVYNRTTGESDAISLESWFTYHPVIFYKNPLGEYLIFTNEKYGLQAECGKPVIYLYPTKTTNVRVQVGADISKSEPLYNNGWQVQADPDGVLKTANGNIYNSLFWEGTGHGSYPNITEGFIVPQIDLEATIKSQLKELGLSSTESADFLNFWLPKMPTTPYIRLTWFGTEQMNELAPLIIVPRPDTTIRIFLDFQGLQSSILLPIQRLTTLPRKGFTVIEWGGLLKK